MKFFGTPGMLVKERIRKPFSMEYREKPRFHFDENGEYETTDEKLIEKLKRKFKHDEPKHCKKCDFTCNNQGELLAHYREIHPKEGK